MIAFDTDVLTEILLGEPTFVAHAANIPPHEQAVPVVVIEEIMRGRLQVIRQAEAGKVRMSLPDAYQLGGWPLQCNVWSYVYAPEGKRRGQSSRRNTAKVTLYLLPVAPTTSDAAEHLGLASVDVIGSARRTAVDARQSAAVPEPTLRVRCEATPQVMQPRSRGAAAVPTRLGVAACVASAPFGL